MADSYKCRDAYRFCVHCAQVKQTYEFLHCSVCHKLVASELVIGGYYCYEHLADFEDQVQLYDGSFHKFVACHLCSKSQELIDRFREAEMAYRSINLMDSKNREPDDVSVRELIKLVDHMDNHENFRRCQTCSKTFREPHRLIDHLKTRRHIQKELEKNPQNYSI